MERFNNKTTVFPEYEPEFADFLNLNDQTDNRPGNLFFLNQHSVLEHASFSSERERFEAELLEHPISSEKAFAWFGLMLGTFPPMAFFSKFIFQRLNNSDDYWIILLLLFVNIVCAVVGYFSGKFIAKLVNVVEKQSWGVMLAVLPFIGILWGVVAGGVGGFFIFLIGAIFGAIIGAMVAACALPFFSIFHRLLKKGDFIDRGHFLPLAFGITFLISAFILGLPLR